jgi:tRNA dimethylallyltransferase
MQNTLLVIAGPTAVGKTALAVQLARLLDTVILSADSRQLYREMNIGTAKPTPAQQQGIPHYFIDHLSICQAYTAADFEKEALTLLETLFPVHPVVILAGGSGLYVKMLCEGMDEIPAIDPSIRQAIEEKRSQQGLAALADQLQLLDPVYAQQADLQNPQRVLRALEVCLGTGLPYSSFRSGQKKNRPFRLLKIGLNRHREDLYQRIDARIDQMLTQGLLEEARQLYPYRHFNALQTVGYQEVFGFLEGQYDENEMLRLLKRNSRHYAKRQLTWFGKDPQFYWFHPDQLPQVCTFVSQSLQ